MRPGPFSLSIPDKPFPIRGPLRWAIRGAELFLGLSRLNRLYSTCLPKLDDSVPFCDVALSVMEVGVNVECTEISRIPQVGPLIVAANHPFGALEGLVLESLVRRVRTDVRVLSNHLLARIPGVGESSIFVDPFGGAGSQKRNARPMRQALEHLGKGGVLIVFPAGEVASYLLRSRTVVEPRWNRNAARMALRCGATVLPVHIEGRNSAGFHLAGLINPRLRTVLLPREFLRMRGREVRVSLGTPIPAERLKRFKDVRDAVDYLRLRTLILGARSTKESAASSFASKESGFSKLQTIVAAEDPRNVVRELAGLPSECRLLESGDFQVFAATAGQIPILTREIGRLREATFRTVGEGTGKPLDLDRFDVHYRHLFAWDQSAGRLVGAYRLGFTEDILDREGISGLYTHTLFQYDRRFLDRIGPAIELGRSFVTAEYQRSYAALLLLWKGIARIVSRRPECRRLFGVVSVSAEFDSMTQRLLMAFLKVNNFDSRSAGLVTPRTPPRSQRQRGDESELLVRLTRDIDDVDELVREIESDRRNVPILLRQYLKLNGQVLGFNIDPAFGHVLDALMLIDLVRTPRVILDRFFGKDAAKAFLSRHVEAAASV